MMPSHPVRFLLHLGPIGLVALALAALPCGCSRNKGATKPPPPTPVAPAAVRDLRADSVSARSLRLLWTAPGADTTWGRAARYDLRYAPAADSSADWWAGARRLATPRPDSAGTHEVLHLRGLDPDQGYRFALQTCDADSNWSAISNLLRVVMPALPDTIPPAAVVNILAESTTSTTVALTWTAPGDDGRTGSAARYQVRRAAGPITVDTWAAADTVAVPFRPQPAGYGERLLAGGLQPSTTYYFSLRTEDEAGNWSGLSRSVSAATTLHAVFPVPTPDFPDLTSAVRATTAGDTVLVDSGTYREQIELPAHRTLTSRKGMNLTQIDCHGGDHGLILGPGCVVEGFTVLGNGSSAAGAAGIVARADSCSVRGCRLRENRRGLLLGGTALVQDCDFLNNGTGLAISGCSGRIENCTGEGNDLAVDLIASQVTLRECHLAGNGIGLNSDGEVRLVLDGCVVSGNAVLGLALGSGSTQIRYSTISRNGLGESPAAGPSGGLRSVTNALVMESCLISGNRSLQAGGGVFCSSQETPVRIARCAIVENQSLLSGGGIYVDYGPVRLLDCRIAANVAARAGGGIVGSGPITLENCLVAGNFAGGDGGGLYSLGLDEVRSCTISGNHSRARGAGILVREGTVPLERSILWGNCADSTGSQSELLDGASLRLTCCAYDPLGIHAGGSPLGFLQLNGGQVTADPLFLAPDSCASAPADAGNYGLESDSPCRPATSPCGAAIGAEAALPLPRPAAAPH